jgi:hypothetical protein
VKIDKPWRDMQRAGIDGAVSFSFDLTLDRDDSLIFDQYVHGLKLMCFNCINETVFD